MEIIVKIAINNILIKVLPRSILLFVILLFEI